MSVGPIQPVSPGLRPAELTPAPPAAPAGRAFDVGAVAGQPVAQPGVAAGGRLDVARTPEADRIRNIIQHGVNHGQGREQIMSNLAQSLLKSELGGQVSPQMTQAVARSLEKDPALSGLVDGTLRQVGGPTGAAPARAEAVGEAPALAAPGGPAGVAGAGNASTLAGLFDSVQPLLAQAQALAKEPNSPKNLQSLMVIQSQLQHINFQVELVSKVVEQATSGTKTILQTQA